MLNALQTAVVGTIAGGLLYGIYLATLIQCFRWLLFSDAGRKPRSYPMAFGTIFIFMMSTITLMTTLAYTIKFLWPRTLADETQLHEMAFVVNISQALAIISVDGILIYRCWIVYRNSLRVICVPVIFWLGLLACSAIYIDPNLFVLQIEDEVVAGLYACNNATTIYTTTAIIYRIWCVTKTSGRNDSPKRLYYIMRILAESGALYTFTIIFSLVGTVLAGKNDVTWVDVLIGDVSDLINFAMAGISFNLLLIRVYQGRVELRDSLADTRNDDGMRTLSGMQFNNPQITASSSEVTPSNAQPVVPVDEVADEIQEHRRSSDGMHVN